MSETVYSNPDSTQTMPKMPDNMPNIPELTDLARAIPKVTESKLTSGELGILWSSYQTKTLFQQIFTRFAQITEEPQAKKILQDYNARNNPLVEDVKQIFEKEQAIVPLGFISKDVFTDAPRLFDDQFHIMFLRLMAKTTLGFNSVNLGMSFRADVRAYYEKALKLSQDIYNECTGYLTDQGVLVRPPYVTMPKQAEFIEEPNYMSGLQLFGNKRALNALEVAYLFGIIEANLMGAQLMTGFAQVAKEAEVKKYFLKGKELAKKIIHDISEVYMQSDIHPPSGWAGKATDSTVPPFSDKLMMFTANVLTSFGLTGNALGMAFSMRSDLPAKLAFIAQDTLNFAVQGGKLMIEHRWLEEPPQMEDRNQIIKQTQ